MNAAAVMPLPRNAILFIGAIGALVIALAVLSPAGAEGPALSVRSDSPVGAMLLARWLEASGYRVRQVLSNPINPDDVNVLFVLNPLLPYSAGEAARVRDWVSDGGVLVVAGQPFITNSLLEIFGVQLGVISASDEALKPAAPTLLNPPFSPLAAGADYRLHASERPDMVVHFSVNDAPIIGSFNQGRGRVWVLGALTPFTNRGLREAGSAELVQNLLAGVSPDAVIGFDEARHGFGGDSGSFLGWLIGTAPGWGLLVGVGVTLLYLTLRGRRFGQPVPLPDNLLRREPVEYIQAMANLTRRAGHRAETLKHYRAQFRRKICERYGLDPRASDNDLLKAVVFYDAAIDEAELRDLLAKLSAQNPTEAQLVETAAAADAWMKRYL